jgi:CRISPR-associated protein Cmr1
MQSITFTCETITPMFLTGADGATPELRAPSIKGALRFWWRAMNGHLSLSELKKREGEIFGDNNNRSKFTINVSELNVRNISSAAPIPHKGYKIPCITPNTKFEVRLIVPVDTPQWDIKKCQALFELFSILGDVGKRARRGMGSFDIIKCSDEKWQKQDITLGYIHGLLKQFSPYFDVRNNAIYSNYNGSMEYYPWIKRIQIGQHDEGLLMKISKMTHLFKEKNVYTYEASIGHASKGRFASPIYISAIKGSLKPVITSLNTIPDRNSRDIDLRLQEDFRQSIL